MRDYRTAARNGGAAALHGGTGGLVDRVGTAAGGPYD